MRNLKLFIDPTETTLLALYQTAVKKHNEDVLNNPYPNAGFDLFIPSTVVSSHDNTVWIDHKVKATMTEYCCWYNSTANPKWTKTGRGFCIYPRSSLSKTPLMLANHVGIIDSGYSGNLIGAFRHVSAKQDASKNEFFSIEKGSRLLQICHPGLLPFTVEIVEKEEDLFEGGESTLRGNGGFGSTGK